MKKLLGIVIVLGLLGLLGWKIHGKVQQKLKKPVRQRSAGAVAVETAPVEVGTIRDVELFTGTLRAATEFLVAPKIAGRLTRLTVNTGSLVKRGDLVAVLEDEEYVRQLDQAKAELDVAKANAEQVRLEATLEDQVCSQQVAQAQAELEIAKANVEESQAALDAAKRELDRVSALVEKKVAPGAERDVAEDQHHARLAKHKVVLAQVAQRESMLKAAQVGTSEAQHNARAAKQQYALAQVSQKEAAQKAAEVRLSYTQIRVDWLDGDDPRVVGQKFVDEGAMLKPNDPISSVLDIRSLVGDIHVTERDYPKLQVGQEAAVTTDAYPGQTFTGKAVRIAPALKEASREALVELAIPNPDGALKPGMFVRAKMEFAKHDGVTRVPVTALVRRNGQQGVFLADAESQKAKFVAVTLGIVDERAAEVTEPPLAGNVVTLGQHLLEDGAAIVLPGSKPGPPAAKMPPAAGKPPAGGER